MGQDLPGVRLRAPAGRNREQAPKVNEFDLTNEVVLDFFTVQGRLLVDNMHSWTDPNTHVQYPYTPVLTYLQHLMAIYGHADLTGASGATVSTMVEEATDPYADCGTYLGDSARIFSLSSLISAITGGGFGGNDIGVDPNHGYLKCSAFEPPVVAHLVAPPGTGALPNVIDLHDGPRVLLLGAGEITYQTQFQVRTTAGMLFNDVRSFLDSFCVGHWRNPNGPTAAGALQRPLHAGRNRALRAQQSSSVRSQLRQLSTGDAGGSRGGVQRQHSPRKVPAGWHHARYRVASVVEPAACHVALRGKLLQLPGQPGAMVYADVVVGMLPVSH
jgi:hypothetical protein